MKLKKGDKVKVLRKPTNEDYDFWNPKMDKYIGRELEVSKDYVKGKPMLKADNNWENSNNGFWHFPTCILEKVNKSKTKKMKLKKLFKKWIKDNDIKVGDIIKVLRKPTDFEEENVWRGVWRPWMDKFIGEKVEILEFETDGNINYLGLKHNDYPQNIFHVPYFILEKVEVKKEFKYTWENCFSKDEKGSTYRALTTGGIIRDDYFASFSTNCKTKAQAKSLIAFAKLTHIVDKLNKDFPEVNIDSDGDKTHYFPKVHYNDKELVVSSTYFTYSPLHVNNEEACDILVRDNEELLKQYFMID